MQRSSPYAWLSTYLVGFFFTYGVYLPFWGLWFESQHVDASNIGVLIGLGLASRCVANLFITPRFSRMERILPALRWMTIGAFITLGAHLFTGQSFWLMATATVLFNLFLGPITPLSDSMANYYAKLKTLDYGRTRLWGSIAFVAGSTIVGYLVANFGSQMILYTALFGLAVSYLLVLRTPAVLPTSETQTHQSKVKLLALLRKPSVLRFIVLVSLIQGSHAAYYGFSAIHWKGAGISEDIIGYLWSLGVISEILVFAMSRRWFSGFGLQALFTMASIGVMLRWGLTAATTDIVALVVVQSLHGVTFALAHIAAIRYIQMAPEVEMVPLQALYNALPMGAVLALMTAVSGWGYQHYGSQVFWVMAVMGLIATVIKVSPKTKPVAQNAS